MKGLRTIGSNQNGASAIEVALIAPILIMAFYAAIEFNRYLMFERRGEMATIIAAEFLSRDDDNVLKENEDLVWQDIWMIVNPDVLSGGAIREDEEGRRRAAGYSRWPTSVDFACDPACADQPCDYLSRPIWSISFRQHDTGELGRDCEPRIVSDAAPHAQDTIREGEVGRAPMSSST